MATVLAEKGNRLLDLINKYENDLLAEWTRDLTAAIPDNRISLNEVHTQAKQLLGLLKEVSSYGSADTRAPEWGKMRAFLEDVSRSRALQGFTADQTATFIFSLKRPLFRHLQEEYGSDSKALASETWAATELLDALGLHTVKAFQKTREDIIARQQEELLELSTPVVKLWDGILALPMIGTLDSSRTQVVMESLLQRIVETGSEIAIIDITGVPAVDTLVAQYLLKTVTAIRLMGAECIISGVRPQIAQTIVHLGVDLQGVTTKASLADALILALKSTGYTVAKKG